MENVKFKQKRRELKIKSKHDKTIQTVTVSVQSAFCCLLIWLCVWPHEDPAVTKYTLNWTGTIYHVN